MAWALSGERRRGLADRSRAPQSHPQAIEEAIGERCLEVRRAHPTWGPLKVRAYLARREPETPWPAASAIGDLLGREGLTVKRRLRRRSPPSTAPFGACAGANDTWRIDFKGWFATGDGARCEPLTLTDAASRYLLRRQALARNDVEHVWPVLDAAFREFGLPFRLRSDNGPPFASVGAGGLSGLSIRVIKAGVPPERIAPGKPQQNGRRERMRLTLLKDAATPPAASLREQFAAFRAFQRLYNEERPHQGLGDAVPPMSTNPRRGAGTASCASRTTRTICEVRRVRLNGEIKWRGQFVYIHCALAGEPVGLAETGDGWTVCYGPILLGLIDPRRGRLRKPPRQSCGLVDDAPRRPQGPQPQQPHQPHQPP